MKLLKLLRKKPYCNDLHFFLIAILLLLLGFKHYLFFIVLGLYLIFIFLKTKILIPILVLLSLFTIRQIGQSHLYKKELSGNISGLVSSVTDEDKYILYSKGIKILVTEKNHDNKPGDIITVYITKTNISPKSYSTDFDYQDYLYSKGISYRATGKTKNKISSFMSISTIKYYYLNYLKNNLSKESYLYVSAMVFGENNLEDNIKDSYSILGISHILAISGLHILFLYKVISFILLKLFKYYKSFIPICIISIFTILIGAPSSALRATLFLIIGALNKKGERSYTRLDILSISCLIMLLINPYQLYSTGFILSYLVSFVIIFSSEIVFSNYKLLRSYKSYYLIYFSTFPIVMNMTNRISLLSLLLSPVLSILVTFILLPISYILAVFPIFDYVLKYILILLNMYLEGLTANNLCISFPSFSLATTCIYYIVFVSFIITIKLGKKQLVSFSFLLGYLVIIFNLRLANPFYRITFIDCGQGDSILIELPHDKGNILIDAYNSYDYLVDIGIRRIDALVLTHSDNDHIGDYKEILENIDVKNIYYPKYDSKMKSLLNGYSIKGLESDDRFLVSNIKFEVLGPIYEHSNVNSNSLVLKTTIEGKSYLFTGDMTIEEEEDLINKYHNRLDVDILKVGHHGSDTSTSLDLLKIVTPDYSIISVSANNSYGLPKNEVVARLKKYGSLIMTKDSGNITIYQIKTFFHISTYR